MRKAVLCCVFCLSLFLPALGKEVTFFELESARGQRVQLRGFLYRAKDGQLILAEEPNLKSCCVARKGKNQITVQGLDLDELPKGQALLLAGMLESGDTLDYCLRDALLVEERRNLTVWILALNVALAALLVWLRFRLRTRRRLDVPEMLPPET